MLDMGGTSCDVCLLVDGAPLFSSEYEIEFGLPVAVPTVSTKTIGAGGGSIGWIDPGGFLQVGPQSAGADPGPACYGRGAEEPTLTDANVVLGRLNPDYFLGGNLALDASRSHTALERLAERLGGDAVSVASSMVRIANENMANAVRIVTVEEGVDPRDHALVAMGGAGPTHAAEIAEAIGIDRVDRPAASRADVRVRRARRRRARRRGQERQPHEHDGDRLEVAALFDDLQATAVASFHAQGSTGEEPVTIRTIAMRYEGQNYEQEIPVPDGALDDAMLERVLERYHELHHEFYGYRLDGLPVELVRLLVTATADGAGALPSLSLDVRGRTAAPQDAGERTADVHFADGGFRPTPVVARSALAGTGERAGPLIVESMDTTVVVPPGWTISSDAVGILDLRRSGGDTTTTTAGASQEARA